jgi:mycothiol synthase
MGEDELRQWFDLPDLEAVVAGLPSGGLVGYADLTTLAEGSRFWIDLRVPPGELATEAMDALLAEMEARAASVAVQGAVARTSIPCVDELASAVLRARRYEPCRYSFRMVIDLSGDIAEPSWPEGVVVRPFVPGRDDEAVYEVQQETFSDTFDYVRRSYDEWRAYSLLGTHDPSLWFLAEDAGELAGISLCRPEWERDPALGWISVLGVRGPWRRRGLGLALLLHSFAELRSRGKRRVGLGVDGQSPTGAVRLYERGGMHVARRFDQYAKPLVP